MREMLIKTCLFLFLLIPFRSFAGGLSAWEEMTPYNNTIAHDGTSGGWITLTMDTTTVSFKHFYFYRGYIVASADSLQYIINEKTKSIQQFTDVNAWQQAIAQQHLDPLWKREFDDCYGTDKFGRILLLLLFPIPLLVPILWLICLISLLFPTRKLIKIRRHFSWIYPAIVVLVILYDTLPQSI
ncbi:MAG: hypothetical protein JO154_05370 [Chitinophaga sp.]|uniref:hypothetical protein n=1 Tax=Chitinophaga sp. TaxID=1869181 RepID=UPI0025C5F270|nr:hypothetical protein [Chitinophaga sp.]MBV8252018.1 hypothetical protein [Chitinophaga sp.]